MEKEGLNINLTQRYVYNDVISMKNGIYKTFSRNKQFHLLLLLLIVRNHAVMSLDWSFKMRCVKSKSDSCVVNALYVSNVDLTTQFGMLNLP